MIDTDTLRNRPVFIGLHRRVREINNLITLKRAAPDPLPEHVREKITQEVGNKFARAEQAYTNNVRKLEHQIREFEQMICEAEEELKRLPL